MSASPNQKKSTRLAASNQPLQPAQLLPGCARGRAGVLLQVCGGIGDQPNHLVGRQARGREVRRLQAHQVQRDLELVTRVLPWGQLRHSYQLLTPALLPGYRRRSMPRIARIVVPGEPHHVTQRGNNRQDVFFADADRRFYLDTLKNRASRFGVEILGYCLMTNHVHLVAVPSLPDSLAKAIGGTHLRYAQYVNELQDRSGHLWQGRFFSIPMDDEHTVLALRYVERNPVRAKLVRMAWRYPWSSAAAHCGQNDSSGLLDTRRWAKLFPPETWAALLREPEDEAMLEAMRSGTFRGRPLGSDRFIARLEAALGMRLRPNPVGRPRKKKTANGRSGRKARVGR